MIIYRLLGIVIFFYFGFTVARMTHKFLKGDFFNDNSGRN